MSVLTGQSVVITGATGSFGNAFVRRLLAMNMGPARICILSRDELKQAEMRHALGPDSRLRWFIGDVRDLQRLQSAFHDVQVVIHAAAMKRVDACEYDPFEAVRTNIIGSENVIKAALSSGVKRVVAISSDKACSPKNLYGVTKACMERLMMAANGIRGRHATRFSVVRYGNVAGARGSIIPVWKAQHDLGMPLTITEPEATRFWFTLDGAVDLVLWLLEEMRGGELVVPRLPSFRVTDLAEAMAPGWPTQVTGHRPGDKLHEQMVSQDEAIYFREYKGRLVQFRDDERGTALPEGFSYGSGDNAEWLGSLRLREALREIGQ